MGEQEIRDRLDAMEFVLECVTSHVLQEAGETGQQMARTLRAHWQRGEKLHPRASVQMMVEAFFQRLDRC